MIVHSLHATRGACNPDRNNPNETTSSELRLSAAAAISFGWKDVIDLVGPMQTKTCKDMIAAMPDSLIYERQRSGHLSRSSKLMHVAVGSQSTAA